MKKMLLMAAMMGVLMISYAGMAHASDEQAQSTCYAFHGDAVKSEQSCQIETSEGSRAYSVDIKANGESYEIFAWHDGTVDINGKKATAYYRDDAMKVTTDDDSVALSCYQTLDKSIDICY